jgi:hypothetical protein
MFDDVKQEDQATSNNPLADQSANQAAPIAPAAPVQPAEPVATPQAPAVEPEPIAQAQQPAQAPAAPVQPAEPVIVPQQPAAKSSIDDMFNDIDPVADKKAQENFIEKPSAMATGKLTPTSGNMPPVSSIPEQPTDMNQILVEEDGKGSMIKKIVVALIGIALVAIVAWAAYYFFFDQAAAPDDNTNVLTNTQPLTNTSEENNIPPEEPEENPRQKDQDSDGLTDSEELMLSTNPNNPDTDDDGLFDREEVKTYHTDPLNPDTDNDGLFDREEVFVWGTDPLNPDTDNDSHLDGVEVANGYNPLGDGLLPEEPGETIEE